MGGKEPIGAIGFRIFVAILVTAGVLAVVLTTALSADSAESPDRNRAIVESTPIIKAPHKCSLRIVNKCDFCLERELLLLGCERDDLLLPKDQTTPGKVDCPDQRLNLEAFPYSNGTNIVLGGGRSFVITKAFTAPVNLRVTDRATLVISDTGAALTLDFQNIQIDSGGSVLIGSQTCRYASSLNIRLLGNGGTAYEPAFGDKFIGVAATGTLEIHGTNKLSWTYLTKTVSPGQADLVIDLADIPVGWQAADQIVIASSHYDMERSETFALVACPECKSNQVKIKGPIKFTHTGQVSASGVDLRAEVGLLTRNVKISGVMKPACTSMCNIYNFDTFGGHIKVLNGAQSFRLEGVELESMGQAGIESRNPINFYRVLDAWNHYVKQLSIHKSYSRCVALEATQNLLVQDVVAYDTMGHCFYLATGTERNNQLVHNLGLMTKSGSVVPSERSVLTCSNNTTSAANTTLDADKLCNGVSTFFITHPSNTLVNNSAAGSESTGFSYSFYLTPLQLPGVPALVYPPENIALTAFNNNTAHSNRKMGFSLGRGIKSTGPTAQEPADYLTLNDDLKYAPHQNATTTAPRDRAYLRYFTAYRNGLAVSVRGGDIVIQNIKLADNDIGVIMSSSDKLPYDVGSRQIFKDSVVVGSSTLNDPSWTNRSIPAFGVLIKNGPILIDNIDFFNFISSTSREAAAFGFLPNNTGQLSVQNTIGDCGYENVTNKLNVGHPGSYWGTYDKDGDLFQIVQDLDGSITGRQAAYIIRVDNALLNRDACQDDRSQGISVCPPTSFGQVFVKASTKTGQLALVKSPAGTDPFVTLSGVDRDDPRQWNTTQYQATLQAKTNYRAFWLSDEIPEQVDISIYNFFKNDYVNLEFCYPSNTTFSIYGEQWDPVTAEVLTSDLLFAADSLENFNSINDQYYYWNATNRLLMVKIFNDVQAKDSNYCPDTGCRHLIINANTHNNQPFYDCI